MDKNEVIARIEDWERRLNELYAQIDDWFRDLPTDRSAQPPLVGAVLQLDEELMKQFDVPPRMLPTRAYIYGKSRVSFVPSALWIIGANGRVNVSTNAQRYILVDIGVSNWQIVAPQLRHEQRSFDKKIFQNLVLHRVIEAA